MNSAIYRGWIRHRRHVPVENSFRYPTFLLYVDLAELPRLFRGRWLWSADRPAPAWFRRRDHIGDPSRPLAQSIASLVEERTGRPLRGPIRLLTHLRYFGHCFNPVSFYYCFHPDGERVETIVAEVTNTPWHETHCYVLPVERSLGTAGRPRFRFAKNFHVSPFMGMDIDYDWRFDTPGDRLAVHMDNLSHGQRIFDATMMLERRPITGAELSRCLVTHPLMTVQVVAQIHWQALKLWAKRAPVHAHPRDLPTSETRP
ncbi:DUF1365 domain-containing protein [bacterium]|nr:DUF1365 domain-containing protein [bacterium]